MPYPLSPRIRRGLFAMTKVKSEIRGYGLAFGSFALLAVIASANRRYSINLDLSLLVVIAILWTAWYGGRGPALALILIVELTSQALNPQFSPRQSSHSLTPWRFSESSYSSWPLAKRPKFVFKPSVSGFE